MGSYRTPGVYRQDVFPAPAAELRTGVPAFLGYAGEAGGEAANQAIPLTLWPQFEQHFGQPRPDGYLANAVRGFFENGGALCYVVRLEDKAADDHTALRRGLDAIAHLDSIDLVCAPDVARNQEQEREPQETVALQQMVLDHCDQAGDRFAILDSLPREDENETVGQSVKRVLNQKLSGTNGALYFPWIKVPKACCSCHGAGKVDAQGQPPPDGKPPFKTCDQCKGSGAGFIPPCGHVAGVYARSDERVGTHKAPANEILEGVLDLQAGLSDAQQGELNPEGVNCLRAFPGRGIRVWGARTLSRDPAWTYVNVRRLFLTAGRWIARNLQDAAFEPHDPRLWARVERELAAYFEDLFRRGALQGRSAEEAFYVKCDAATNPPAVREAGQLVTEIGLAPAAPAEFVVVRIVHGAGGVTVTGPGRPG